MKPILSFFTFLFISVSSIAQSSYYTKKFTPQQLKEDLNQYRTVMETLHPSLYWYTSKVIFDEMYSKLEKQIANDGMTEFEFYNEIAAITAKINCGHTGTMPSYVARKSMTNKIPIEFKYLENKLYITRDYSSNKPLYKEITSINDHSISEIIEKISRVNGTDGYIETPNGLIFEDNNSFSVWYHLVFPMENEYKINFYDGTFIIKQPISRDSLMSFKKPVFETRKVIDYELKKEKNAAVLTINSFEKEAFKDSNINYKKYLDRFFKTIQSEKIEHLIIDLRHNGGGEDNYANLLYSYLTDKTFQYYKDMETNYLPFDKEILEQVEVPFEVKNGLARQFFIKKENDRFFVKKTFRTKGLGNIKPQRNNFNGKLYFLISGESYSASAELVAFAKNNRPQTIFIGEECGGAMEGNTSAIHAFLTLKNTYISTYIPLVKYRMNIKNFEKGRGVIPDYEVQPTISGFKNGKDEVMEFMYGLL